MARTAAGEKWSRIKKLLDKHKTVHTLTDKDWELLKRHCLPILQKFGLSKKDALAEIIQEVNLSTQLNSTTRTMFTTRFIKDNTNMQPLLRACAAYVNFQMESQMPQANPAPTIRLVPKDVRVLKAQANRNFLIRQHGDMPKSTHRQLLANEFAEKLPCKVDERQVIAVNGDPAYKENQWLLIDARLRDSYYECVWIQCVGHTLKLVRNSCLPEDLTFGN